MLVLSPIFEADLQPEPYGYRPERSAKDAVRRIHRLLNTGHRSVIDADWSHYFGEIPHAERMKSLARRISDGRMLGLIKRWRIMAVVEDNGRGDNRHTNRARRERKGIPQGSPISSLLSNIYMRRILLGWKLLGHAWRFGTEIVAYADDFCVLGKAPPAEMMQVVTRLMGKLKLPLNAQKIRCLPCPEESFAFLGYRIGGHYRPKSGRRSLGTRPSKASVQSICRRISAQTDRRFGTMPAEEMVQRLNGMISGWAHDFTLGQVRPAYRTIDQHATRRLRPWFCRKHKMESKKYMRFSNVRLWEHYGLIHLAPTTRSLPWAKAARAVEI